MEMKVDSDIKYLSDICKQKPDLMRDLIQKRKDFNKKEKTQKLKEKEYECKYIIITINS